MSPFHETLFPLDVALKSAGGPERRTDIVTLGSGREQRNARWADSRRRYDAGYGVKTLNALQSVVAFFEERRGQLYGFRWRDRLDHQSGAPAAAITAFDQTLGTGDGTRAAFQLVKLYGDGFAPYTRTIAKPVAGSVRVAVGGVELSAPHVTCDVTTGMVTFATGHIPAADRQLRQASASTCRCASTRIISKSISRPSRPARFRKFRWLKSLPDTAR